MEEENNNMPERVFALITDGEIFHKWYVEENYDDPGMASLIYGLQSQPIVVDITDRNHEEIQYGWKFDGISFYPETLEVENE
jgi:uncharacterized protein YndB with AHSA1/START domain